MVWDKERSEVKIEEEEEDGKNKKKKNNTKAGKRKVGETFKRNIGKICEEKDFVEIALDIEEAEEEEVSKKTRRRRKQNDERSGEEIEEESVKKTSRKKGKLNPLSVEKGKVHGKKKAKPRTIRNITKITLGKKAADKMKDKNKNKILEEAYELDFEEEWEEEEELSEKKIDKKKKEEGKIWMEENRRDIRIIGRYLNSRCETAGSEY